MLTEYILGAISFLICPYLFSRKRKCAVTQIINIFFFIIASVLICIQLASLIRTGLTIPPLALTNIDQVETVENKNIYLLLILFAVQLIFLFLFRWLKLKRKRMLTVIFIILMLVPHSPIYLMGKSVYKVIRDNYIVFKYKSMEKEIVDSLKKAVVSQNSVKNMYVEMKENILVIFTEGMSYQVISKEVTPNIYKLQNSALNVVNYFNHTAATFRGLRGQLSSSHQASGGFFMVQKLFDKNKKNHLNGFVDSLPKKLNELGYTTYFQSSNKTNESLSILLKTLNFSNIIGLDNKKGAKQWVLNELTDKDSYELLFDNLEKAKQPFFYGVYTVETHAGLDSTDKKYRDGKNPFLNKFYNMDFHFGEFLDKFNKSDLSKNTTIIFTSDHASYPENDFKNTFKTTSPYMVDKIPLIIYSKGATSNTLDVHGLNSLTLAPTILDMLGYDMITNFFIGSSIFDSRPHTQFECIAALGFDYFNTCDSNLYKIRDNKIKNEIQKFQSLGR